MYEVAVAVARLGWVGGDEAAVLVVVGAVSGMARQVRAPSRYS